MKNINAFLVTTLLVVVIMLVTALPFARADLPVHCLYNSTAPGVWEFQLTDQNMSGDDVAAKCDIRAPVQATRSMKVYLQMPDIAIDEKGNTGFFTLVYDQGFEVVVGGNKYWAFFNYTTAGKDSQGNDIIISNCDQTFTGWYHEAKIKAKSWGCFRGRRLSLLQGANAAPSKFTHSVAPRPNYKGMVFKNDMSLINDLNALHAKGEISWKAKPMQEWEDQPLTSIVPKFGQRSEAFRLKQRREHTKFMRSRFGEQVNKKALLELRSEDFSKAAGNLTFNHLRDVAAKGFVAIPKAFDWRNVNGQDFVSPIRNQGECGSCYSFATTAMMEARKRVFTQNKEQPVYSPENIISCSFYSQGCEGGFAYLISKWGEDFGIIAESCDPYTAAPHKCNLNQACATRQYWTNYRYTGGYYGAVTVENMQLDILKYGPLAVSMEVYNDLFNYHSGIYRHVASSKLTSPVPSPFELTNHVVLIVGWGENEKGEKYWIVKNSWGTKFGIDGFFWVARGVDECAIESENASSIPAQP